MVVSGISISADHPPPSTRAAAVQIASHDRSVSVWL
jgi:hypothetical protein